MVVLGEGGGGGVGGWGGNNGEKKVCFKMHFRQKKVFLDHVFVFLMENQVIGDPPTLS